MLFIFIEKSRIFTDWLTNVFLFYSLAFFFLNDIVPLWVMSNAHNLIIILIILVICAYSMLSTEQLKSSSTVNLKYRIGVKIPCVARDFITSEIQYSTYQWVCWIKQFWSEIKLLGLSLVGFKLIRACLHHS